MKLFNCSTILLLAILFFAGEPVFAQRKKPARKVRTASATNNLIKNGIQLKINGFKVSDAYLMFDDENLVPEDNKVDLNQNVNMILIIEEGWNETGGGVFPGSKQVIKLSNGKEISNSEDLFAAFDETGVSTEEARYITLNAQVTDPKTRKNTVVVNFRVWDKKGAAEITGSYKLYIK
ncbi:MAG: hypothetical protein JWP81_758 [Ferruginibacter sp.]|nr:hypothetical protein [Ferruginibacter sp.]